MNYENIC